MKSCKKKENSVRIVMKTTIGSAVVGDKMSNKPNV